MRRLLQVCLLVILSGCATTGAEKLYNGDPRPDEQLSRYSLLNYADFFRGPQIYTVRVDDIVTEKRLGGFVALLPGKHTFRISFKDADNYLLPVFMKVKVFQGWYDVQLEMQAGKTYAPIFNLSRTGEDRLAEMCIAELAGPADLESSRTTHRYLACAPASIPPTPDNIKLCTDFARPTPYTPPKVYEEFCYKFAPMAR